MIGEELSQLLLDELLIAEHYGHLALERVHLLDHRDMVYLGFIPECVEPYYEAVNLILNRMWRNGIGLLKGCWWERLGRRLASLSSIFV